MGQDLRGDSAGSSTPAESDRRGHGPVRLGACTDDPILCAVDVPVGHGVRVCQSARQLVDVSGTGPSLGLGRARSAGTPVGLLLSWPQATSRSYGRSAGVVPPRWHPYFGRRQATAMWLLARRRCWHPYVRRGQLTAVWLLARRSGLVPRAVWAGTRGTCGPILVELIEFACAARTRTAAVSASAARAAASLERLRAPVCLVDMTHSSFRGGSFARSVSEGASGMLRIACDTAAERLR
jgi:hypothetical protein